MTKFSPRTPGQRISLFFAVSSALLLAACGGGGGGDTATPTPPATIPPDPVVITSVKIESAAGCNKAVDANTCNVVTTVTANKAASILVVGGLPTDVGPGTNLSVTLAAPGLGAKTVLLTAKDGSGTDQVVVTIGCEPGLTPDASTGKCNAPTPVYQEYAWGIGGAFDTFHRLTPTRAIPVTDLTGQSGFNCAYALVMKDGETKGSCTSRLTIQRYRVVIDKDNNMRVDGPLPGEAGFTEVNPADYVYDMSGVVTLQADAGVYTIRADAAEHLGKVYFRPTGGDEVVIFNQTFREGFNALFKTKM